MKILSISALCPVVMFFLAACGGGGGDRVMGHLPEDPLPASSEYLRGSILPFNEAPAEPSLEKFISELRSAADRKDVEFVLSAIRDSTVASSEGDLGKERFTAIWQLETEPEKSSLWKTLDRALSSGGGFYALGQDFFVAPYYFMAWPAEYNTLSHAAIIGDDVLVLGEARADADVIDTLNYQIVKCDGVRTEKELRFDGGKFPLYRIELPADGRTGWVSGQFVRFPVDYRIGLKRDGAGWYISFLVAGF